MQSTQDIFGLRRVFLSAFTARDVAEPLVSFDDCTPDDKIRSCLEKRNLTVVGIRVNGLVDSFVELESESKAQSELQRHSIDPIQLIPDSLKLVEVVTRLEDRPFLFISVLGQVGGIVRRNDLQKPASRMWLFGLITLIEMRTSQLIEKNCPDDQWKEFLSEGRIQKATIVQDERNRRNQIVSVFECLQLSDKLQIVARNESLRDKTLFESRRQMEQATKAIEKLRNNLAHSQKLQPADWQIIVELAKNFDKILKGPPGLTGLYR